MEPPAQKIANPTAVFSGLDKITGRIINFEVAINETVRFGALEVTPRVCYTRPPTMSPNTDGFIEVDELTLQGELRRIFTGWMFAASPGLNAVEHPIYDVWLTDCKGGATPAVTAEAPPAPAREHRRSEASSNGSDNSRDATAATRAASALNPPRQNLGRCRLRVPQRFSAGHAAAERRRHAGHAAEQHAAPALGFLQQNGRPPGSTCAPPLRDIGASSGRPPRCPVTVS